MFVFTLLAVAASVFCVWDFFSILQAVDNNNSPLYLDTATYYLLVLTVFFWFSLVSYFGQKTSMKKIVDYAFSVAALWFVITLGLGYAIPFYLQQKLESANYVSHADEEDVSRLFIGKSLIYLKSTE